MMKQPRAAIAAVSVQLLLPYFFFCSCPRNMRVISLVLTTVLS